MNTRDNLTTFTYTKSSLQRSPSFFTTKDSKEKHIFLKNIGKGSYAKARLYTGNLVIKEFLHFEQAKDCRREAIICHAVFKNVGFLPGIPHRILMPYIKGLSLYLLFKDITQDFKENPINCLKLIRGIFEAYHDLNKKNIIHNDFNFSNILIDENGKMWIIDFGKSYFFKGSEWKTHTQKDSKEVGSNLIDNELLKHLDQSTQLKLENIKRLMSTAEIGFDGAIKKIDEILAESQCLDHSTDFLAAIVKKSSAFHTLNEEKTNEQPFVEKKPHVEQPKKETLQTTKKETAQPSKKETVQPPKKETLQIPQKKNEEKTYESSSFSNSSSSLFSLFSNCLPFIFPGHYSNVEQSSYFNPSKKK